MPSTVRDGEDLRSSPDFADEPGRALNARPIIAPGGRTPNSTTAGRLGGRRRLLGFRSASSIVASLRPLASKGRSIDQ